MKLLHLTYRFLKSTLSLGIFLIALTVAGVFVGGKTGIIPEPTPFIVLSGSMEPKVKTGSVVMIWPDTLYSIGDIITFSGSSSDQFTTHRIMQVYNDNGTITYQTQGDANHNPDPNPVSKEKVKGKVVAHLPYVGYAASMAKEPKGFIALVIIPATIVVYEELRTMARELKRALFGKKKKRSKEKASTLPAPEPVISHQEPRPSYLVPPASAASPLPPPPSYAKSRGITAPLPPADHPLMALFQSLPQATLNLSLSTPAPRQTSAPAKHVTKAKAGVSPFKLIPVITAVAVFVSVSGSYFLDQEISFANILAAGTWSSPDTPPSIGGLAQTLVINEIMPASTCYQGQTEAAWLEIYNGADTPINLQGYQITDGLTTINVVNAGNIDIPAGQMALLAHNTSIWNHCWSIPSNAITANLGGQINLNTGTLQLLDPQGTIIDTVKWGSGQTHQPAIDQSLERAPTGWDTAFGNDVNPDDFYIPTTPSPGY